MKSVVIAGLVPLLVSCAAVAHAQRPPLVAAVVGDRVYWKGKSDVPFVLRLHSASLQHSMPIRDDDFPLPRVVFARDSAIAWHIRDQQVWALACYVQQHAWWPSYLLSRIPLALPKSNDIQGWKHVVGTCHVLTTLHVQTARGKAAPPFYFDFVPVALDRGKLFLLGADRIMTVWDLSLAASDPKTGEGIQDRSAYDQGIWIKGEEFGAEFFEPFQIYLQKDGPMAIAKSGELYTIRATRGGPDRPVFRKEGGGPIVAVIDDSRTGKVHAFTKTSCYWLNEPGIIRRFDFPDISDDREKTAEVLLRAVEFLDRK